MMSITQVEIAQIVADKLDKLLREKDADKRLVYDFGFRVAEAIIHADYEKELVNRQQTK